MGCLYVAYLDKIQWPLDITMIRSARKHRYLAWSFIYIFPTRSWAPGVPQESPYGSGPPAPGTPQGRGGAGAAGGEVHGAAQQSQGCFFGLWDMVEFFFILLNICLFLLSITYYWFIMWLKHVSFGFSLKYVFLICFYDWNFIDEFPHPKRRPAPRRPRATLARSGWTSTSSTATRKRGGTTSEASPTTSTTCQREPGGRPLRWHRQAFVDVDKIKQNRPCFISIVLMLEFF